MFFLPKVKLNDQKPQYRFYSIKFYTCQNKILISISQQTVVISYLSGLSIQVRLKLIIIQGILLGHSSVLHWRVREHTLGCG